MNGDGNGDKELLELNYQLRGEQKRVKDGVAGEEHVSAEDDELNVNGTAKDVNDGNGGSVHAATVLKISQQPPLNAMVCWERFLHIRSLKVLLVENDDSTRHVVAALLRNCSYDVIEAANGVQAWRILEDLTNHIDLVLTEVVMPCVSGVSLLCKIMSHKTRRNIPVIMMSSHDSMGLVFKCLSKGAVDFLVKPIRKNELKNLWQHVWRRCHSSSGSGSGSGSESGTQTQKSVKTKSVEKSDNNSGSNDEDDNGSVGLNVGDGSDDGSGTQSSWTKQAVEVDSPRPELPHDRVPECPDSTCAQVIHSNAEASGNKGMPLTATREFPEHEEQLDIGGGFPRNVDLQLESRIEVPIKTVGTEKTNQLDTGSSNFNEHIDKRDLDLNSVSASSKLRSEAANLTSITTNTTDIEKTSAECDAPYRVSKILDGNDKIIEDNKELPSLELGLKRLRGVKDVGTAVGDERNVLRRSDSSAFSRYNASSNTNKLSDGNIGSTSAVDNSLEVTRKGLASDIRSQSVNNPPNQSSNNVGSNNIDMDSTTNNAFINPVGMKNNSSPSTVKISHPSATLQPLENDLSCAPQNIVSKKADDGTATGVLTHPAGPYQDLQIDHLQHHYDHHLHLSHKNPQKQTPAEDDDMSLRKMAIAAPHCGSSNVLGGPFEGNTGNYSVNGSASGSNHGSNGPNGSSTAVNTGGTNIESDNGIAGKSGSGSGNRVDQDKSHRAAALTKFRQKRKERCFRKKVRYQSRQRIAEQRPRVRGQFAHLTGNEGTSRATDD